MKPTDDQAIRAAVRGHYASVVKRAQRTLQPHLKTKATVAHPPAAAKHPLKEDCCTLLRRTP